VKRRATFVTVVAILLVAAGVGAWIYFDHHRRPSDSLVLQGNVDVREVSLSFQVPGRIDSLMVDEGDSVKAGQIVATLETGYFEDAVREATAAVESAKADLARLKNGSRPEEIEQARAATVERRVALDNARADYNRFSQLSNTGGVSKQTIDAAKIHEGAIVGQVLDLPLNNNVFLDATQRFVFAADVLFFDDRLS